MDLSSDSDDCQLYTKTAENVATKKKLLEEDREELVLRMKYLPDDQVQGYSHVFDKIHDLPEPIVSLVLSSTDSEDEIPLAQLRSLLRARTGSKRQKTRSSAKKNKKRKTANNPRVSNNSALLPSCDRPTSSNNTNMIPTIVLDDDTGYPTTSFAPIHFNTRKDRTEDEEDLNIISLDRSQANYDDDDEDLDTPVKILVNWKGKNPEQIGYELKHFQLRRYQKFETIYEELAKMEGVPLNRVVILRNFETIRPRDTPASLKLTYYGNFLGRVTKSEVDHSLPKLSDFDDDVDLQKKPPNDELKVKLLLDTKTSLALTISKHQNMKVLYKKCAEELKLPDGNIRISFDGDVVHPSDSVSDLGIEDGDVLHVILKKD